MALVSHLIPVETRFHETNVDITYSRYRKHGDLSLDESFFPVVWDDTGYRKPRSAGRADLGYGAGPGSMSSGARPPSTTTRAQACGRHRRRIFSRCWSSTPRTRS